MLYVVELGALAGERWQARLLDLMDALDRLGADEIDAHEDPSDPRAYGYFHAAPEPAAVAALERLEGVTAARVQAQAATTDVEVPDGAQRPFVVGPFEVRSRPGPSSAPHPLVLETYTAWGTGMHPTTAMMLHRLAASPPAGRVLDVGTGTGVLALGAIALGAAEVHGTDIEDVALEAATKNAAANGMQAKLTVSATPPDRIPGEFEVVLANIRCEPLCAMAEGLVARLAPGGRLFLSGVRAYESARVRAAFEAQGLRFVDQTYAKGWLSLRFETKE